MEFFEVILFVLAPTRQRNVVSKSHTQMTPRWVRVANIHVHNHTRMSSLLGNDHSSLQQGGEGDELSSTGVKCSGCPERAGRHWHSLGMHAQLVIQVVPICWGELQVLKWKGPWVQKISPKYIILKFTHTSARIFCICNINPLWLLSTCQCPSKEHELRKGLPAKRYFKKLKVTVQFLYLLLVWIHHQSDAMEASTPGIPEVNGNHLGTLNGLQNSPKNSLQRWSRSACEFETWCWRGTDFFFLIP